MLHDIPILYGFCTDVKQECGIFYEKPGMPSFPDTKNGCRWGAGRRGFSPAGPAGAARSGGPCLPGEKVAPPGELLD